MFRKAYVNFIGNVVAAILSIYGLCSLPLDIFQKTQSMVVSIACSALIIIVLGGLTIYHFAAPIILKGFGVKRYQTEPVLIESNIEVDIDANFRRSSGKTKNCPLPSNREQKIWWTSSNFLKTMSWMKGFIIVTTQTSNPYSEKEEIELRFTGNPSYPSCHIPCIVIVINIFLQVGMGTMHFGIPV
ncbi:MAG: hypothetical protein V4594_19995 [Bacteroidota bacterium]